MSRVLHITDCHLVEGDGATLLGIDTAATLNRVLAQATAEATPDVVIASGDLAHDPVPACYERIAGVLARYHVGPVLWLAGNHDVAAAMGPLFEPEPAVALGNWEVVGFDTHEDEVTGACFGADRRAALLARIAASPADHVLLACHHPPLEVGCPWLDRDRIPDGESLLASVAASGRVRGWVFGHVHQEVEAREHALLVLGTPSTCFQFAPRSPSFAIDHSETRRQPGYRWLELGADGRIRTQVGRVMNVPMQIELPRGS
jgi:3',5'-cyclic-AMP phosphodiesterase